MSNKPGKVGGFLLLLWAAHQTGIAVGNAPGDLADIPNNLSIWKKLLGTMKGHFLSLHSDPHIWVPLYMGLLLLFWPSSYRIAASRSRRHHAVMNIPGVSDAHGPMPEEANHPLPRPVRQFELGAIPDTDVDPDSPDYHPAVARVLARIEKLENQGEPKEEKEAGVVVLEPPERFTDGVRVFLTKHPDYIRDSLRGLTSIKADQLSQAYIANSKGISTVMRFISIQIACLQAIRVFADFNLASQREVAVSRTKQHGYLRKAEDCHVR